MRLDASWKRTWGGPRWGDNGGRQTRLAPGGRSWCAALNPKGALSPLCGLDVRLAIPSREKVARMRPPRTPPPIKPVTSTDTPAQTPPGIHGIPPPGLRDGSGLSRRRSSPGDGGPTCADTPCRRGGARWSTPTWPAHGWPQENRLADGGHRGPPRAPHCGGPSRHRGWAGPTTPPGPVADLPSPGPHREWGRPLPEGRRSEN